MNVSVNSPSAGSSERRGRATTQPHSGAAAGDAVALVRSEMAALRWSPGDLVAACAGSPSRATVYHFLAGQRISRRCQAQILRAIGQGPTTEPQSRTTAGTEIRLGRQDLGLTMRELAARAGMHPDYLAKIELGRRATVPARTLARLAQGLEWEPEAFNPEDASARAAS
jgi:DNA-binding Xre family transcriptional regulator